MRKIEDLVLLEKIGIILTIMAHDSDNELSKKEVGLILSEINSMLYTSGLEDTEYEHLLLNSDEIAKLNPLETMIGHFKSVQGTPASWELCQSLVKMVKEEIKDYDDYFKIWLRDVIIATAKADGEVTDLEKEWVAGLTRDLGLPAIDIADAEEAEQMLARAGLEDSSDGDEENTPEEENENEDRDYPAITFKVPKNEQGETDTEKQQKIADYIPRWLAPTKMYARRLGFKALIPSWFEKLNEACPKFSSDEMAFITQHITEEKVIPCIQSYTPEAFMSNSKQVWWCTPFVLWAEQFASWVYIDKNGFYAAQPENSDDIICIAGWDMIDSLDIERIEPNLIELNIYTIDGGNLTFVEFLGEDKKNSSMVGGSYLEVIVAIYNINLPTIKASAGQPMWYHGVGGEGFKSFDKPSDLLSQQNWKEGVHREDPKFYGYSGDTTSDSPSDDDNLQ
jgi:hypothetical protein